MKQHKKLGRGLEDFSHLFISASQGADKPLAETSQVTSAGEKTLGVSSRSISILSHRSLDERAFLVINLAWEMSRQGRRVLLLDGDFSIPRLAMFMDGMIGTSLTQCIASPVQATQHFEGAADIRLITLDLDLSTLSALSPDQRGRLADCLTQLEEQTDVILVIASPTFLPHMKMLMGAVDEAVVITPSPLAEMINAYALIKLIVEMNPDVRVGIVSSGVTSAQADMTFEKMQRVAEKFLKKRLYRYGCIPFDGGEALAGFKHRQFQPPTSSSTLFTSINHITRTLFEEKPGSDATPGVGTPRKFAEKLFSLIQG